MAELPGRVGGQIEEFHFKAALHEIMAAARESNRYFDHKQPWVERKTDLAACGTTINVLLHCIRTFGVVVEPFLPFAAGTIARMLRCEADELRWQRAAEPLPEGRALGEAKILFTKLEVPEAEAEE